MTTNSDYMGAEETATPENEYQRRAGSAAVQHERVTPPQGGQVKEVPSDAAQQGQEAVDYMRTHSADEIAQDAKEKAGELADEARQKTAKMATKAADRVDDAMTTAGERMEAIAQAVRDQAPSGRAGEIAGSTAEALDRGGAYLRQADLDKVRGDLEALIRRRPTESLLVGLGLGFLLARLTRR
jgi:hypothetical protein